MSIEVRLFATLRKGREKKVFIDYTEDITCKDIIKELKIDKNDVSILLVNGINSPLDKKLSKEDVVSIFPPVGGG